MQQTNGPQKSIFSVPPVPRTRTSDVLLSMITICSKPTVSLGMLTERMGDRTFGLLLILVSVFNVIPFASIIAGLLLIVLGIQMMIGMRQAWLPRFILNRPLKSENVINAIRLFEPKIRNIERFLKPRLQFTEAYIVDRFNGVIIMILGAIITIPIPFTNLPPAFVLIIMGMGLVERDGLVQIIAAILGVAVMFAIATLIF